MSTEDIKKEVEICLKDLYYDSTNWKGAILYDEVCDWIDSNIPEWFEHGYKYWTDKECKLVYDYLISKNLIK